MSGELHRRQVLPQSAAASGDATETESRPSSPSDRDDDDVDIDLEPVKPDLDAAAKFNQNMGSVPQFIKSLTQALPARWVNWTVRFFTTILLLGSFLILVYLGPLALVILVLVLQFACFYEIINIGCIVYRSHDLPWFRILSCAFHAFFPFDFSTSILSLQDFLQPLVTHHHFLSFTFYLSGIVLFVLSLVKKHYFRQFILFGWTHVTLLSVVFTSHFQIYNIFNGIIWFLLPVLLVICNDIMAYVFGFFYGKTPLIRLSPKKTWEGFIGGGISTLVLALLLSVLFVQFDYFVCPLEWDDAVGALTTDCTRNPVFMPQKYNVSKWLFMLPFRQFTWYPFFGHAFVIALYTSVVGPFGGFFASGFKRAFKIKDFGDVFPGHGGVVDRFDCQFIVGVFVYIYYKSFVHIYTPASLLDRIYILPANDQLIFYRLLTSGLNQRGLIPPYINETVSDFVNSVVTVL